MKRSDVNRYIKQAEAAFAAAGFILPPFSRISAEKWAHLGPEYDEIRDRMLGWDITDFGKGEYEKLGLLLFTLRNGDYNDPASKTYAEKLMYVRAGQVTPMHFHWKKMEDIINRGGGNLLVCVYNANPDGSLADTDVEIHSDGRIYTVPAGSIIRLTPGESMTMTRGMYHSFWGEPGCGRVMVGEVSMTIDDRTDNCFLHPTGRFPAIEEDEAPLYLLGMDYAL